MTIDNHCGQDDTSTIARLAGRGPFQIALEQSALYAARLAIARWINSSAAAAHAGRAPDPAASRATWYAQAQQNFQEWLGRGGFAQYDIACAEQPRRVHGRRQRRSRCRSTAGRRLRYPRLRQFLHRSQHRTPRSARRPCTSRRTKGNGGIAPPFPCPTMETSCEECKFSLCRIRDAVSSSVRIYDAN